MLVQHLIKHLQTNHGNSKTDTHHLRAHCQHFVPFQTRVAYRLCEMLVYINMHLPWFFFYKYFLDGSNSNKFIIFHFYREEFDGSISHIRMFSMKRQLYVKTVIRHGKVIILSLFTGQK